MNRQHAVASFVVMCAIVTSSALAQDAAHENVAPKTLDLVSIGNGRLPDGQKTAFRIYKAHDGNGGQVLYTRFDRLQPAKMQIEDWLKATRSVTSRQRSQSIGGQLISDRIVALEDLPKSGSKEFVIIRRDGLNCYLIESTSLDVAIGIESLIEHK